MTLQKLLVSGNIWLRFIVMSHMMPMSSISSFVTISWLRLGNVLVLRLGAWSIIVSNGLPFHCICVKTLVGRQVVSIVDMH